MSHDISKQMTKKETKKEKASHNNGLIPTYETNKKAN